MTWDQLWALPADQQLDTYRDIYGAYLLSEDEGDSSQIEEYEKQLWLMNKYCSFSKIEAIICEVSVTHSRVRAKALVN